MRRDTFLKTLGALAAAGVLPLDARSLRLAELAEAFSFEARRHGFQQKPRKASVHTSVPGLSAGEV